MSPPSSDGLPVPETGSLTSLAGISGRVSNNGCGGTIGLLAPFVAFLIVVDVGLIAEVAVAERIEGDEVDAVVDDVGGVGCPAG